MPNFGNAHTQKSDIRRLLVIKWGALGDLVASTPAIQALRQAYPRARITVVSNPPFDEILPPGSLVDEIILLKRHGGFWIALGKVRSESWDVAVNLSWNSERSAILSYLSGAPLRAGSGGPGWLGCLYNRAVPKFPAERHEFERHLDIVRALGIPAEDGRPIVQVSREAKEEAKQNLLKEGNHEGTLLVGMHPGASSAEKSWGEENYAWLGKEILRRFRSRVMITWGPGEEETASRMVTRCGERSFLSSMTPKVENLAALISACRLYICNCSGPMNVSLAVGTPTIALLGPTRPEEWGAYGGMHRTLKAPERSTDSIPRNQVWQAVCELLEKQGLRPA